MPLIGGYFTPSYPCIRLFIGGAYNYKMVRDPILMILVDGELDGVFCEKIFFESYCTPNIWGKGCNLTALRIFPIGWQECRH